MRHTALSRRFARLAFAAAILLGTSAAAAHAVGPIADRWEARGDRIDHRLDARGDRIDGRLDHRADVAEANGREHRAERLDDRGDRIDDRLDARGDRLERRADRIGQRRQGRRG
jgi:hypothetical protein